MKLPRRRRVTALEVTLLLSVLLHAVGLFGWSLFPPVFAASREEPARDWSLVELVAYREHGPVSTRPADAAPPRSSVPRRATAPPEGYVGHVPVPQSVPRQQPRHRAERIVHDVPAPPPPVRESTASPQAGPSVAASSDPPPENEETPKGAPSPVSPLVASSPSPSPVAPAPTVAVAPLEASAQPSPSPVNAPSSTSPNALAVDPQADFSLIISYHNDERIRRDATGALELDIARISELPDVKPVLAQNTRAVLALKDAGRCGLHPLNRVKATVRVSVDLTQLLPQLVSPRRVEVLDLTVDGRAVQGALRDHLVLFIQDGVYATKWLPASSKGSWSEHSEQAFEVEVLQAIDTAMSPPTSRGP